MENNLTVEQQFQVENIKRTLQTLPKDEVVEYAISFLTEYLDTYNLNVKLMQERIIDRFPDPSQ